MVFKNNKYLDDDGNEIHYIATADEKTVANLRSLGFEEIGKQGDRWFFVNRVNAED